MSNPTRWLAQQYYIILYNMILYILIYIYIYIHCVQGLSTPLKDYQTPISPIRVWSPLFFGWGYLVRNILRAPPNQSIGTSTRPKLGENVPPIFCPQLWGIKEWFPAVSCIAPPQSPKESNRHRPGFLSAWLGGDYALLALWSSFWDFISAYSCLAMDNCLF